MLRNMMTAAAMVISPGVAVACSPPLPSRSYSDVEIAQQARLAVRRSTIIVDARVSGWSRNGGTVLQTLRQFKGPPRARLVLYDGRCGTALPRPGKIVRLLLASSGQNDFHIQDPSLGGTLDNPLRLERAVDRLIGKARLPGTISVVEDFLPPPAPRL